MIEIFLRTLPFFAIVGLGFGAGRLNFFGAEATAYLTRFVFYFALSAMLFRFASTLPLNEIVDWRLVGGYLSGTLAVYLLATLVAALRGLDVATAAVEAQCSVIGNVGFLGLPMFVVLFGDAAIGPVMLVLATDLIVFSSLIVILINGGRGSGLTLATLRIVALGLVRNPMIVSIMAGLIWSALSLPIPEPLDDFLTILGAAATPGALFAIGASLAGRSAERVIVAGWLSLAKLVLHPLAVAFAVLLLFPIDRFSAMVVISAASLPVAGNVFMLAQEYGVAPQRASSAILLSTAASILTVPIVIAWLGYG
ncbi:MAG: AEC family transporter [Marinibacterium sp.]